MMGYDWETWDPYDSRRREPWDCPACGTDNRADRANCRICMFPRDNLCTKCHQPNEETARYCRFCGALTVYNRFSVFDPEQHEQAVKDARETDRRYMEYGHYFQWEDGPYQGPEEMYTSD